MKYKKNNLSGNGMNSPLENQFKAPRMSFSLSDKTVGYAECLDNCWNFSIFAMEHSFAWLNEYNAGYIQGRLQGESMLKAARDNTWKNLYLTDTSHSFPHELPPSANDIAKAEAVLTENLNFMLNKTAGHLEDLSFFEDYVLRLQQRMLGIYEGATGCPEPTVITFDGCNEEADFKCAKSECLHTVVQKLKDILKDEDKMKLGYGSTSLSYLDVYFINAQMDLADVVAQSHEGIAYGLHKSDHCSAFVKRTGDDILWTHNSWCGFLTQSMTISYSIYGYDYYKKEEDRIEFITQNSYCPGQFGSNMDFGFNYHGICFNETTHRYTIGKPKTDAVWLCWRAAVAEMFAKNIDEFYEFISIDNSGTYLNGYMVIDSKTEEVALIEMSYRRFVKFLSDGKSLTVSEKVDGGAEQPVPEKEYDHELITPEYIFGVNFPVSKAVAEDLQSTDNRPMRRVQFKEQISSIQTVSDAKALITYVGKDTSGKQEPLSIFGRWDLGYGTTEYPKTVPDGSVDAKACSVKKVRKLLSELTYIPDAYSNKTSFWMRFGTPEIDGKPFIWNESAWYQYWDKDKSGVPNQLDGKWHETKLFMK